MAITRSKKEEVVQKIKEIAENAQTITFISFDKVTAEEANTVRNACADAEVGYTVAKKTLIQKAFEGTTIDGEFPNLEGEVAVAYGKDLLAPARIMGEQSKALDGRLQLIGGVFEGDFISAEEMKKIAAIPPIETLYAQFLTVISAPVRGFVSVLDQIAKKEK